MANSGNQSFIDGSRLIIEASVRAGADVFIGYPITPANLLYLYSSQRFKAVLPAPDEITTLQWMSGYSAAGKLPVTATSYPGLALMIESIGMAYMMELPMVIILAQRLGPATGTATCGAQGDVLLLNGMNSGGYSIPTFCISDINDCWTMSAEAVRTAVTLRTPVFLLTSKEMVMTIQNFDMSTLPEIKAVDRNFYNSNEPYVPYKADNNGVPPFLPVGNEKHRVRITASTHDHNGDLQHTTPAALANTARLQEKMEKNLADYTHYELSEEECDTLVVSYDITAASAREAVERLRNEGKKVSLFIPKTLFPVPPCYLDIVNKYKNVVVAEENFSGQYREILFGKSGRQGVRGVNVIGRMITPEEIIAEVLK